MYDTELVREIVSQILKSLDTVIERFSPVKAVGDLTQSARGMEKLDAICKQ
jgi:hypothetical protein